MEKNIRQVRRVNLEECMVRGGPYKLVPPSHDASSTVLKLSKLHYTKIV